MKQNNRTAAWLGLQRLGVRVRVVKLGKRKNLGVCPLDGRSNCARAHLILGAALSLLDFVCPFKYPVANPPLCVSF